MVVMEITLLPKLDGFQIKGKEVTVAVTNGAESKVTVEDFVIWNAGEYETKGVRVYGYPFKKETIYLIQIDDVNIAYLNGLTESLPKELNDELGTVNILMIKASENAEDIVSDVEPGIVLPFGDEEKVTKFAKDFGEELVEKTSKLKVTSFDSEDDETRVVILN